MFRIVATALLCMAALAGCVTVNVSTGPGEASSAQESKANADTSVDPSGLTKDAGSVIVK